MGDALRIGLFTLLVVYLTPMGDIDDSYSHMLIVYLGNDPVCADAIAPVASFIAAKRLAMRSRVCTADQIFFYPSEYHDGGGTIQLLQCFDSLA